MKVPRRDQVHFGKLGNTLETDYELAKAKGLPYYTIVEGGSIEPVVRVADGLFNSTKVVCTIGQLRPAKEKKPPYRHEVYVGDTSHTVEEKIRLAKVAGKTFYCNYDSPSAPLFPVEFGPSSDPNITWTLKDCRQLKKSQVYFFRDDTTDSCIGDREGELMKAKAKGKKYIAVSSKDSWYTVMRVKGFDVHSNWSGSNSNAVCCVGDLV